MLPLFLFTLLLLIQIRHYTVSHINYFTRQRAAVRVQQFIEEYAMSKLEQDIRHEKKLTSRLIEGIFSVNMYSRGLCPC